MSQPVILCVDDEKIILDSLEEQIERTLEDEFELELAESAQEGLEIINELDAAGRDLALVISDEIMPGIKGHRFLSDVHRSHPHALKILLTGQADLSAVQAAINSANLYRYVAKPWEAQDFMMTVSAAARSFVQRQQLEQFNESNKLLRELNKATQQLSGMTTRDELYHTFIQQAVKATNIDLGFLLLDQQGEMGIKSLYCRDKQEHQRLEEMYLKERQILRSKILERIQLYGEDRLDNNCIAVPLMTSRHGLGYIYLENSLTEEPIQDIQFEIIHMLVAQLEISLDKARLYQNLQARTEELEQQKAKMEEVNDLLAEKNQDIIDSINYARRIQEAILPEKSTLAEVFRESFIMYRPKDIVSGDFYWWAPQGDAYLIAAVDCTGHGVPGAFMSVIAHNLLQEVAATPEMTDVGQMLEFLHRRMQESLQHNNANGSSSRETMLDGMDLALCRFHPGERQLAFGGAYRPLLFWDGNQLQEIPGTRASIGGRRKSEREIVFQQTVLNLKPGDSFYVFSDGFTDQFGGEQHRKFTKKRLMETVRSVCTAPMQEQHYTITKSFLNWKGEKAQTDDVVLLGFRFSGN